jgi:hypothetical protein
MKRGLFVNLHGRQLGQLIEKQKKKLLNNILRKKEGKTEAKQSRKCANP